MKITTLLVTLLVTAISSIATAATQATTLNIIPTPLSVSMGEGSYRLTNGYGVSVEGEYRAQAEFLIEVVNEYTKLTGRVVESAEEAQISISIDESLALGEEAYRLDIDPRGVRIVARDLGGVVNGVTSLLQITFDRRDFGGVDYPCCSIEDRPKYSWRSFLLDSGRQYHSLEFIKSYLRHMAMLKLNIFHWHLTETDGWRLEIKRYPKLTEVGSAVATKAEQKGFYTQEDVREIIAYAKELNITVMPEIDMPGHAEAAMKSYPEISCRGVMPIKDYKGVHSPYLFCAGRESTYEFIENILDEVCELFDSQYIHLGGDEAPKAHWDECRHCQKMIKRHDLKNSHNLQIYFSTRIADYLSTKGRKAIFWDDIIDDSDQPLPSNVVIHWWNYRKRGEVNYRKALEAGLEVICGTNYYTYLYLPVTPWANIKEDRTFDMRKAYDENPSDIANPSPLVLGMSCCMWSDFNSQEYMVDRKVFPRIYALAEQMWSCGERDNFEEFYERVKAKYRYLEFMHVDYGPALREETPADYRWE